MTEVRFTGAPDREEVFEVGDVVEVYCDHENKEGDRVRDWLQGVVVQADEKMVAVQFQENVYLTDGWMVPDHVLWSPQKSPNIRPHQPHKRRRPPSKRKPPKKK